MESFFSLLQKNAQTAKSWDTRDQRRIAIVTRVERSYHRRRHHTALGCLTPIEYELIMSQTADQAAQPTVTSSCSRPLRLPGRL
jgi:putative transposase